MRLVPASLVFLGNNNADITQLNSSARGNTDRSYQNQASEKALITRRPCYKVTSFLLFNIIFLWQGFSFLNNFINRRSPIYIPDCVSRIVSFAFSIIGSMGTEITQPPAWPVIGNMADVGFGTIHITDTGLVEKYGEASLPSSKTHADYWDKLGPIFKWNLSRGKPCRGFITSAELVEAVCDETRFVKACTKRLLWRHVQGTRTQRHVSFSHESLQTHENSLSDAVPQSHSNFSILWNGYIRNSYLLITDPISSNLTTRYIRFHRQVNKPNQSFAFNIQNLSITDNQTLSTPKRQQNEINFRELGK